MRWFWGWRTMCVCGGVDVSPHCGGWLVARVLLGELFELYSARVEGRSSTLDEPLVQYADYSIWKRELDRPIEQRAGWSIGSRTWAERLPVLDLPEDRPPSCCGDHAKWVVRVRGRPPDWSLRFGRRQLRRGSRRFVFLIVGICCDVGSCWSGLARRDRWHGVSEQAASGA